MREPGEGVQKACYLFLTLFSYVFYLFCPRYVLITTSFYRGCQGGYGRIHIKKWEYDYSLPPRHVYLVRPSGWKPEYHHLRLEVKDLEFVDMTRAEFRACEVLDA